MIEIIEAGPLATIQDLGRPGYAALGVPGSGAFDRAALRLANRLVGNADTDAGVEITLGGFAARFAQASTIALTGAVCPGAPDRGAAVTVPAGARLRLGTPATGLRTYLAVRGGIAVDLTLGSRSTDTLSGLGPAPLRAGDRLPVGTAGADEVSGVPAAEAPAEATFPIVYGPRERWFTRAARTALVEAEWTVGADSNRVGLRLSGPVLHRRTRKRGELSSEPVLPGALQVPGDGRPILFGPDAPVTGGYPVIAVVTELDRAGQLRPGDRLRFVSAERS